MQLRCVQLGHSYDVYPALTPLRGRHPGEGLIAGTAVDVSAHMHAAMPAVHNNKKRKQAASKQRKPAVRKVEALRTGFMFTHKGTLTDLAHALVLSCQQC